MNGALFGVERKAPCMPCWAHARPPTDRSTRGPDIFIFKLRPFLRIWYLANNTLSHCPQDACCWSCSLCREDSVVVGEDECRQCPIGYSPSQTKVASPLIKYTCSTCSADIKNRTGTKHGLCDSENALKFPAISGPMSAHGRVPPRLGIAVGVYTHRVRLHRHLHHPRRSRRFHHLQQVQFKSVLWI